MVAAAAWRLLCLESAFAGFQGRQYRPASELILSQTLESGSWLVRFAPMEYADGLILSWRVSDGRCPLRIELPPPIVAARRVTYSDAELPAVPLDAVFPP